MSQEESFDSGSGYDRSQEKESAATLLKEWQANYGNSDQPEEGRHKNYANRVEAFVQLRVLVERGQLDKEQQRYILQWILRDTDEGEPSPMLMLTIATYINSL